MTHRSKRNMKGVCEYCGCDYAIHHENERLRGEIAQLKAAYEIQMRKTDAAEAEIERLQSALGPFADAVYNDNGDMTITPCGIDEYAKAYFAMRPHPSR